MVQRHLFNHYLARTAGMLSGAQRASLMLLVMLLTASNAWAGVVNLTEDTDETAGTAARWYVNMPETGSNSLTLADASITSFKVYDNGGKSGTYSNYCNGTLVINAPSGYGFRLSGRICTEQYNSVTGAPDYLHAYDGNVVDNSKRILSDYSSTSGNWKDIIAVTTLSESLTLYFKTDDTYNYDGLDLTVTLVGPDQLSRSSITMSDYFYWNNGNAIDIAYTVKDANGTTLTKGTHFTETIKKGSSVVSDGVKDLGDYTLTISGTGSYSGEKTVNFSVVEENCLYGVISGTYPDYTMTLKYGNYYDDPASESANNKKKFTPGSTWWNRRDGAGMKTIVIDASCQNYQGTSLSKLFYDWRNVTSITGLENLNYHNTVTDMSYMFGECDALTTFDVSSLNTASVTNMNHMFYSCGSLATINFGDGTKFNTSNVTNMNYMFTSCAALTELDLSSFSTTRLSNFERMFQSSSNLQTIIVSTGWDVVSGSRDGYDMFYNCSAIVGEQGTTYDGSNAGRPYAHIDGGTSNPGYLTGRYTITYNANGGTMPTDPYVTNFTGKDNVVIDLPTPTRTGYAFAGWCENSELSGSAVTSYPAGTRGDKTLYAKWSQALYAVVNGTTMTLKCGDPTSETGSFTYNDWSSWNNSFRNTITNVVVDASCQNYTGTTLSVLFYKCENLTTITGLDNLNTENVTNMENIFGSCYALTSVDVSKFNTSKVTDMSYMFSYCRSLTTLDVSSFNTDKVTNMRGLFECCKLLTTIDIRNFNTGEVKYMDYMFELCDQLTTIIVGEGWSTAKVTSSETMFRYDDNLTGQEGTKCDGTNNIDGAYARVDATGTPGYLSLGLNEATGIVNAAAYTGKKAQFTRTGITANAYSTVCLPFDFTAPTGCTIYGFQGIHYDEDALGAGLGAWVADIAETTTMTAHTPYIFTCTGTEATFGGTASNAADYSSALESNAVSATVGTDQAWTFKGTYSAIDWSSADPTEPTYGFSTYVPAATTIAAGTFVRFVQGASLAPFRARLIYSGTDTHLNAPKRSAATELPQYIIVRIVGSDGSTTAIGTLDTRSGEISTGDWFDLNGRRLSGKPAKKGLYINNGKKVIIK